MKIRLYRSGAVSELTHCHEVWKLDTACIATLELFNACCLQAMTGRTYREETVEPTFDLIAWLRSLRLRWLGHILRMDEEEPLRQMAVRLNLRNRTHRGRCSWMPGTPATYHDGRPYRVGRRPCQPRRLGHQGERGRRDRRGREERAAQAATERAPDGAPAATIRSAANTNKNDDVFEENLLVLSLLQCHVD